MKNIRLQTNKRLIFNKYIENGNNEVYMYSLWKCKFKKKNPLIFGSTKHEHRKTKFSLLFAKFLILCLYSVTKSHLLQLRYFVRTVRPTIPATNVMFLRQFYKIYLNFFCICHCDRQLLWTFSIQILCKLLLINSWLIWTWIFFFVKYLRKS